MVYFTRYFRQYLLGRHFEVRTDHSAISWLRKTSEPIGQNARWLELLDEYDFEVQHRPGHRHGNADALSRHPCLNKPSCTACQPKLVNSMIRTMSESSHGEESISQSVVIDGQIAGSVRHYQKQTHDAVQLRCAATETVAVTASDTAKEFTDPMGLSRDDIEAAQKDDPEINFIVKLMMTHNEKPLWKEVELQSSDVKSLWHEWERLGFRNGVLCRKWTLVHGTDDRWQVVIPRNYRRDFLRMVHTGMNGGHLGRSKTEEQVQKRAYWPNWRAQVAAELKQCNECVRYYRGKAPQQTPLQPFGAGEPFKIIAVDVTGKHTRSTRGNQYIVTVTDLFSKWSEAYPVRTHTAPVVARVLVDNWFSRFGMPKRLLPTEDQNLSRISFKNFVRVWKSIRFEPRHIIL